MTILVTGAAGFIGSNLVETLLKRGETVVGIDDYNNYYDPARKRANVATLQNHPNLTLYEQDFCNAEAIQQIFRRHQPKAVAHLGAYGGVRYSIGRASLYTQVNIVGTVNLLEAARLHNTKIFVFASTSSAYGNTTQIPYRNRPLQPAAGSLPGQQKKPASHGPPCFCTASITALRFFSVYGPRGRPDMMPYQITDSIVHDRVFKLYNSGEMYRDWTYVADIVSGIIAALERPLGYQIIHLGRGEPVLMADFVHISEELAGNEAVLSTRPPPQRAENHQCQYRQSPPSAGLQPPKTLREGWENVGLDQAEVMKES
jgi:UDP-glucuronate 4-epimerase